MPMREERDIFLEHPTAEMAWLVDGVRWSCHNERANAKLSCHVHFLHAASFLGRNFAATFASVCLISPLVRYLYSLWAL